MVGFKWPGVLTVKISQECYVPAAVLVKFRDPRVDRIHSIPVPGSEG